LLVVDTLNVAISPRMVVNNFLALVDNDRKGYSLNKEEMKITIENVMSRDRLVHIEGTLILMNSGG